MSDAFVQLLLAVADDKLMLGHRNSDWTGLAPILEEDIAFSSLAQDEMAHAQALYELAATMTGTTADQLAFGRDVAAYRCAAIVELTDEFNFGTALVRQFFCDHCDRLRLARLAASNHKPLADLAKRLLAEEQVHVEHVDGWIRRLGRGTTESRTHVQRALDALAPLAPGLFEPVDGEDALVADGRYPRVGDADPFETWAAELRAVAQEAGLTLTLARWAPDRRGGRRGVHSDQLGPLLDEMCEVFRQEPTAAW